MTTAYELEIKAHCPNAEIVFDLFHVIAKYGREVIDRVRARGAQKRVHAEDPTDASDVRPAEEMVGVVQERRLVRQAMESLTPDQRTALSLAYYEGLSHSQIADRLHEPLGTVKTRIRQAMLSLRRTLGPVLAVP